MPFANAVWQQLVFYSRHPIRMNWLLDILFPQFIVALKLEDFFQKSMFLPKLKMRITSCFLKTSRWLQTISATIIYPSNRVIGFFLFGWRDLKLHAETHTHMQGLMKHTKDNRNAASPPWGSRALLLCIIPVPIEKRIFSQFLQHFADRPRPTHPF